VTELLQSPFTIGVCLVALVAWILTLVAIFWPGGVMKTGSQAREERDARF
jgi:hypothetical protein